MKTSLAHVGSRTLSPAMVRLSALAALDAGAIADLTAVMSSTRTLRPRRELVMEGQPTVEPLLLLDGWAARMRMLADGRRQILGLLLPGDPIGLGQAPGAPGASVVALTEVSVCRLPAARDGSPLADAYALARALAEAQLLAQITRLGRLSAHERIADLLLELHERLTLAGIADGGRFPMPLTQEVLADTLGLTSVHVNRTLQMLRRRGVLTLTGGHASFTSPELLAEEVDRRPMRLPARAA